MNITLKCARLQKQKFRKITRHLINEHLVKQNYIYLITLNIRIVLKKSNGIMKQWYLSLSDG